MGLGWNCQNGKLNQERYQILVPSSQPQNGLSLEWEFVMSRADRW